MTSDRFLGITNFCFSNGLEFVVVTEETIRVQPRLNNIKSIIALRIKLVGGSVTT